MRLDDRSHLKCRKADFKEKRSGITLASGRAVSGRHGYGANDYTARATTDPWTVPAMYRLKFIPIRFMKLLLKTCLKEEVHKDY